MTASQSIDGGFLPVRRHPTLHPSSSSAYCQTFPHWTHGIRPVSRHRTACWSRACWQTSFMSTTRSVFRVTTNKSRLIRYLPQGLVHRPAAVTQPVPFGSPGRCSPWPTCRFVTTLAQYGRAVQIVSTAHVRGRRSLGKWAVGCRP